MELENGFRAVYIRFYGTAHPRRLLDNAYFCNCIDVFTLFPRQNIHSFIFKLFRKNETRRETKKTR